MQLARLFDFLSLSLFFYFLKKKTEAESNLIADGLLAASWQVGGRVWSAFEWLYAFHSLSALLLADWMIR
jgi:hypothetical protein